MWNREMPPYTRLGVRNRSLRRLGLIVLAVSAFTFIYLTFSPPAEPVVFNEEIVEPTEGPDAIKVKVVGQGVNGKVAQTGVKSETACKIPKLDPHEPEIMTFDKPPTPLNCTGEPMWMELDQENRLVLTEYAKKRNLSSAKCTAQFFERINDDKLRKEEPIPVKPGDVLDKSDYFQLNCTYQGRNFTHLFMNLVVKKDLVEKQKSVPNAPDWSGLNLFFMGFDSMSQQAYRRSLPLTVRFLEEELEAVVLNGYNIVGDGTPQAFIPILTGRTEEELPLTRRRYPNASFVDAAYPFAWRNFSDAGYATVYGEDAARVGTFTYRLKGFRRQPTHHYTRTYFQWAERAEPRIVCNGPIPQHKTWFKYANDFMRKYPREARKFLLMFHSVLSHDDINQVKLVDAELRDLLRGLQRDGHFADALVVIMADHGNRFAAVRNTQQGQLEERLPFMSLALPPAFARTPRGRRALRNLRANRDRLTTPFDIHATLLDLLHFPSVEELDRVQDAERQRSISLFRQVPELRSCAQAGIAPHWCTCLAWERALDSPELRRLSERLAEAAVRAINAYTRPERRLCAPLRVRALLEARRAVPDRRLMRYNGVRDRDGFVPLLEGHANTTFATYQLRFATTPGDALYEATLAYNEVANEVVVDFASISHVNKFGDTPHCIIDKNYFLATYCVCYDKIGKSR